MHPAVAILLSFLPVFGVLGVSALLKARGVAEEICRKVAHILLSNWILLALALFEETWAVCVAPACFVALNYLSYRKGLFSAIERGEDNTPGTVWFAVSLLVLCGACWHLGMPWAAACGMLAMGYGDGFAALVGMRWGRHHFPAPFGGKSLEGAAAVAGFTAACVGLITRIFQPEIAVVAALCTAVIATAAELYSPQGLDNLTLPLAVSGAVLLLARVPGAQPWIVGLALSLAILLTAFYLGALTGSGLQAGTLLGTLLYALGGPLSFGALVLFFVLGSLASRVGKQKKADAVSLHKRHGPRTAAQVAANGLPPLIFAVLYALTGYKTWLLAVLASFAAAAADTFSSEIGMLSGRRPVSILTFKPIQKGISGGVTLLGFCGAAAGSFLVSLLALPGFGLGGMAVVLFFGVAGSLLDSVMGALFQAKYHLPEGGFTERPFLDGVSLALAGGIAWVTNDVVNFTSMFLCGVLAFITVW